MLHYGFRGQRVAIVEGVRTPFAKSGTELANEPAISLARHATAALMQRSEMDGSIVDLVVMGTVLPSVLAPNMAREVSLMPFFPRNIPAHTVGRACASANQAITDAADQIVLGNAKVAIAGGAESLSQVPILHSRRMSDILIAASKARSIKKRISTLARIRPADLIPVTPAIVEPSTGETMGESADGMAKKNGISREQQDSFALRSHLLASAAFRDGRLSHEIEPLFLTGTSGEFLRHDTGVRSDSSMKQLSKLKPVFDKKYGTVTAGNSSPLTDGAAVVMLMREDIALALGYPPLGYIRAYANAAIDPMDQLLQAPVFAIPLALAKAGLTLAEIGLVEMHEAFASQVLSNLHGLASSVWAERAGLAAPVGEIDPERLNVMGGSISIGHPFGATGARLLTSVLNEMKRRDEQFGLISVCAAGGMGHAMIVER